MSSGHGRSTCLTGAKVRIRLATRGEVGWSWDLTLGFRGPGIDIIGIDAWLTASTGRLFLESDGFPTSGACATGAGPLHLRGTLLFPHLQAG